MMPSPAIDSSPPIPIGSLSLTTRSFLPFSLSPLPPPYPFIFPHHIHTHAHTHSDFAWSMVKFTIMKI
ncbi:hypothetical protein CMV_020084 [Castanea mollissima]|uniref:Uncharacterized protein n=1 Tax=Castanea mollissima TaxID=60419 RepID=A0A8J4VM43_9ROSI|nr:hypothetical protein CMV_020084 [Castanea mollissima]